ncbi:MAG: UvrB/UvrC motif-containing protein [Synergistes sp.]|nr:UvrB/UvrC motif-containing protein [Synergistes sp.]
MLCEQCKERRAEVHLVTVINGERCIRHLCRECAENSLRAEDVSNLMRMSFSLEGLMGIEEAFKELVLPALRSAQQPPRQPRLCPHCGAELPSSMFESTPMARPARAHRKVTKEEEIAELTKKMEKAAKSENYELAARLRDKISELKQAEETENTDKEKTAGQEGAANEA